MKKISLFFIIILVFSSFAFAVPYVNMNTKLINSTQCEDLFKSIPDQFMQDIRMINVYPQGTHLTYGGVYYLGGVINLYTGCDEYVLIHELAHACQEKYKDTLYNMVTHKGVFTICRQLIRDEVYR